MMETLGQIGTQLGIDQSFYYLFGLMFVLYFVLSATYLRPYQKLLHKRKERTEGLLKEAKELSGKADETFAQYRARLKEMNDQARQILHANEEAGKKEESKLLGEAASSAKTTLQSTQKELDTQKKAVLDALSEEVKGIASEIAAKVLGRSVSAR